MEPIAEGLQRAIRFGALAMRTVLSAVAAFLLLAFTTALQPALADIVIRIDKSSQRMSVTVDGFERYSWTVSTGRGGGPPSGVYRPLRLERQWYSRKYGMSPMPHAIFFREGYAIHGTYYLSQLGQPASHGCVRLHPENAATLFGLVKEQGVGSTRIMIQSGLGQTDRRRRYASAE